MPKNYKVSKDYNFSKDYKISETTAVIIELLRDFLEFEDFYISALVDLGADDDAMTRKFTCDEEELDTVRADLEEDLIYSIESHLRALGPDTQIPI